MGHRPVTSERASWAYEQVGSVVTGHFPPCFSPPPPLSIPRSLSLVSHSVCRVPTHCPAECGRCLTGIVQRYLHYGILEMRNIQPRHRLQGRGEVRRGVIARDKICTGDTDQRCALTLEGGHDAGK